MENLKITWFRRRAGVLAVLCLVVVGFVGWSLYSRWMVHRKITLLAECEGGLYLREIHGPDWFTTWVKKWRLPIPQRPYHFASSIATDADMKYVAEVPTLRGITLVLCPITDAGMIHLRKLRNVEELNLNGTLVSDKTLEYISQMTELKELHLHKTAVTDAGLTHLLGLKKLEFLGLGRTGVTDKGVAILTKIESLRDLDLGSTEITDAALEAVTKMPNLQLVNFYGANVTGEGLSELKAAHPKLKVSQ